MTSKSFGKILNRKMRKKMIYLYEEYIQNTKDNFIKKGALDFDMEYPQMYSKIMNLALDNSWGIYNGNLPKEKAKKILQKLKNEEEEDV